MAQNQKIQILDLPSPSKPVSKSVYNSVANQDYNILSSNRLIAGQFFQDTSVYMYMGKNQNEYSLSSVKTKILSQMQI